MMRPDIVVQMAKGMIKSRAYDAGLRRVAWLRMDNWN